MIYPEARKLQQDWVFADSEWAGIRTNVEYGLGAFNKRVATENPLVFISHDSRDADLAEAFGNLLTDASGGILKSFRSPADCPHLSCFRLLQSLRHTPMFLPTKVRKRCSTAQQKAVIRCENGLRLGCGIAAST